MDYSNKQTLDLMKDYFVYLYKKAAEIKMDYPLQLLVWKNRREVFPFVVDLLGLNKFPVVLSNEDFAKISSPKLYRGVRDPEHMANMLCDFNYHHGTGINDGLYASNDIEVATSYTNDERTKENKDYVLSFKLDPSAKICRLPDIKAAKNFLLASRLSNPEDRSTTISLAADRFIGSPSFSEIKNKIEDFYDYLSTIDNEIEKEVFTYSFKDEHSKFAIYLGFDAMFVPPKNLIIFNREKIMVPQSEFNRFVANSKGYNADGTIKRLSGDSEGEECGEKIPQKQ